MAIVVTELFNRDSANGSRDLVLRVVKTDAGAEADAIVADKSTFLGPNGLEPSELIVEKIDWSISDVGPTFAPIVMEWDLTADEVIAVLANGTSGCLDFRSFGGVSPQSGGSTGDIVITNPAVALGSYTIILYLRKKD